MPDDTAPRPGSFAAWREGDRRRYGIVVGVDASGDLWLQRLHHPWRRCRRTLDSATVLADPAELLDALDALAVTFAKRSP